MRPLTLAQACAQYPHRFTMDHVPAWARDQREDGTFYAPQFRSDAEWYELAKFPGEGGLSRRSRYCTSGAPTWPLGKSLPAVYSVGTRA